MPQVAEENRVDSRALAVRALAQPGGKWDLVESLSGGTQTMRDARTRWLPMFPKENPLDYDRRVASSFLFGALRDTVESLSSRPFSKPVSLQGADALDPRVAAFLDDPEDSGQSLTEFAREAFRVAIRYGLVHILVDFPQVPVGLSLADERSLGLRPRAVIFRPPDLLGWRTEEMPGGSSVLSQVRLYQTDVVPHGAYGERQVERVRVYNRDTWELWERVKGEGDYAQVNGGAHSFGAVPLQTIYFNRTGMLIGEPALEDLAWLNVAHWQSYSDQRNILSYNRVPLRVVTGMTEDQWKESGEGKLGPQNTLIIPFENAKVFFLEHSGSSIAAGREDLKDLKEEMELMGLQPLVSRSGGVTATAHSLEASRTHADIQAWINISQTALWEIAAMAGRWHRVKELPEDFSVDIYQDFVLSLRASEDIKSLIQLRLAHEISQETFWAECKRRGLFSENFDAEEERERIEVEGLPLGIAGVERDASAERRGDLQRELAAPAGVGGNGTGDE